ncbi:UNVERIFIED_CONTAM: hypothetical protein FKN15_024873 [Acipenser sinensis]
MFNSENQYAKCLGKVAQTACMSACKHLSTSLTQMLLDSELKQISMGAIQQFNLDVMQCECNRPTPFPTWYHTGTEVTTPVPTRYHAHTDPVLVTKLVSTRNRPGSDPEPYRPSAKVTNYLVPAQYRPGSDLLPTGAYAPGPVRTWSCSGLDMDAVLFASSEPVPGFQGDTLQLAFIDLRQLRAGARIPRGHSAVSIHRPQTMFASSEPVPGFQGDTLQLAFIDLRQLLDLFMVWDWSTYLADYGQPTSKYLRVNPSTALALLEKMKDTSKKNNIFSQFRKNDRDKQKLIETVVKQLRSLVNGMSQHT